MDKLSIRSLNRAQLEGKRALVRVDFNVPMDGTTITDDARIKASMDTINYLRNAGAKVILMSHLGRPKAGEDNTQFKLDTIGVRLSKLTQSPVTKLDDCVGQQVKNTAAAMNNGDIILLENTRFHKEETKNDPEFSKSLASLGDLFVNDAFGVAHRAHASTTGVAEYLPAYAGLLLEQEIVTLDRVLTHPKRPLVAIIGGAKISSKFAVLKNLLGKVDTLIIGGGMTYTLLKAQGQEIGKSLCENDLLEDAKQFLVSAQNSITKLILPTDHVCVTELNGTAPQRISETINTNEIAVDIGPKTTQIIMGSIASANTIIWNGPLGVFEIDTFAKGTMQVANALAKSHAFTLVGGGDSGAAIAKAGVGNQISHISTGGGATLEYLEGKKLPGIEILENK